jgi:hypothetical protein
MQLKHVCGHHCSCSVCNLTLPPVFVELLALHHCWRQRLHVEQCAAKPVYISADQVVDVHLLLLADLHRKLNDSGKHNPPQHTTAHHSTALRQAASDLCLLAIFR